MLHCVRQKSANRRRLALTGHERKAADDPRGHRGFSAASRPVQSHVEHMADWVGLCRSKAASVEVRFKGSAILITAAIDGQGVALARRLLVHDDLDAAALGSCGLMPHRGEPPPPTGASLSVRFTPRVVPGESSREKVDECTHLRWCIGARCVDAKERSLRRFGIVVRQHFN